MGCNFNCVIVPKKIQTVRDLRKFYEEYKDNLLAGYGEDFEGYSGDMAVDDGSLVVKKNLKLETETDEEIKQEDMDDYCSRSVRDTARNGVRASR
jgi:hypothetical protein